jgi:adenylate kinase family enzyme
MKIYITGSAGSGKSTYANNLQKELNIPLYSTDDLYDSSTKQMFSLKKIMNTIPIDSDWIIEGAYYIPKYIRAADKVIYIKIGFLKTIFRILKRWFKDKSLREKYSFLKTLKLVFTTVRDKNKREDIDLNTNISGHYTDKNRFELCKANAKKLIVL